MKPLSKWAPALCLLLTAASMPLTAAGPSGVGGKVYRTTLHSTALVLTAQGQGTGWVVNRDKKQLITCRHVVGTGDQVVLLFPQYRGSQVIVRPDWYASNGDPVKGRVVATDAERDLALVEAERLPEDVTEMKLADDAPEPGDTVHAVGCPGGTGALWVYCSGTVRAVTEEEWRDEARTTHTARVIETQLPLNPGDSGGPLVNDAGELVGVNEGRSRTAQLVSQSIEVSEVREFLKRQVTAKPWTAEDFYRRGLDLKARKEYREAAEAFAEAIERDPGHLKAHVELAWVLNELKEYQRALPVCLAALEIDDECGPAWREAGYAYWKTGDVESAETALRRAVRVNGHDRSAVRYLAQVLEAEGKTEEADVVRAKLQEIDRRTTE